MTVGYSTNLQLVEPVTGTESGNWGYDINYGTTDYIDIAISGTNTITTDGDVTLAQTTGSTSGNNIVGTTAQYYILNCTGARTANRNIIAPAISKTYYVINGTTGGYAITIKKSGGTGVTIPPGAAALVAYNGTDFQGINAITGTLGFSDTNIVISSQVSANTYVQGVIQNTSSGTAASADFIVANNLSTATTYYGDFGINSSTFSGTGSLNAANATYVTATSGDLSLGTTTSNSIHLVINGSATDAMTINTSGAVAFNGSYGTSGQALLSGGSSAALSWGILTGTGGGTGVNNGSNTITLGGSFTTSGAFTTTLTVTASTNVTLPTTGTLATLAGTETFTNKTLTNPTITAYLETAPALTNSSTAVTLSLSSGTVLSYTLTGNCTFTMPTATSGTSFIIKLIQDGTGSRTATFTGVKWPGGTAPTITTTATTGLDILSFVCINSVWYGTYAQAFA